MFQANADINKIQSKCSLLTLYTINATHYTAQVNTVTREKIMIGSWNVSNRPSLLQQKLELTRYTHNMQYDLSSEISDLLVHNKEKHWSRHYNYNIQRLYARMRFVSLGPFTVLSFIFMAALCNRGAIIFLPCSFFLSFYLLSFFPRLISAAADWMSTILLHMAWP